jgi:hypothetical protein
VSVTFSNPTPSPWGTAANRKHSTDAVTGRRDGHFKSRGQPVQRVAEFTPEPIADNSILRGVFFVPEM